MKTLTEENVESFGTDVQNILSSELQSALSHTVHPVPNFVVFLSSQLSHEADVPAWISRSCVACPLLPAG